HTRWPRDWSSDVCSSDLFQVSGLKHVTHKPEEPVIVDALRESSDHDIMIETPKAIGDISLDEPGCPGPGFSHVPQCGMTSPARRPQERRAGNDARPPPPR